MLYFDCLALLNLEKYIQQGFLEAALAIASNPYQGLKRQQAN